MNTNFDPELKLHVARWTDREAVHAFLQRLTPATVRARYFVVWDPCGPAVDNEVRRLLIRDHASHVVVLAQEGSVVRGIGEFVVAPDGTRRVAELAVLVEDSHQRRGVGHALYGRLVRLAQRRGVSAFSGEVQYGNGRVLQLLRGRADHLHFAPGGDTVQVLLSLGGTPAECA
jgi:GNAT superfamily N-acetyltransferase